VVVPVVAAAVPGLDNSPTLDDAGADHLDKTIAAIAARPEVPLTVTPSAESLFLLDERDTAAGTATIAQLHPGAGRQVLAGPYAPIDTGAWIDSGLVGEMDDQYVKGTKTLQGLLQSPPDETAAVLDRTVSLAALDHLRTLGVDTVVAPSDQLTRLADPVANADFAQQFEIATSDGTKVRAVVGDAPTAARLGRAGDPVLAGHQALAELACLSLAPRCGPPSGVTKRGVAVSVPPTTDPTALTTFLNGLADPDGAASLSTGQAMVAPLTLDQLVAATEPTPGRNPPTTVRAYEADPPADLGSYPSDLRGGRSSFAGLENLVPTAPLLTEPVDRTLLSSGARNLDADQREAVVGAARNQIGAVTEQIVVTPEQIVTLTSSSGKVPLNLENRLQTPASVRIVLDSAKLEFPEGSVIEETLAPAQTTTINLPVETRASGAFPLNVMISSADGTLPVATTRYTVRSTAISGVGLVLSIGAGLFLLIWWARHFRTTRRARKLVGSTHPALSGIDPDGYAPPDTDPMEGR